MSEAGQGMRSEKYLGTYILGLEVTTTGTLSNLQVVRQDQKLKYLLMDIFSLTKNLFWRNVNLQ